MDDIIKRQEKNSVGELSHTVLSASGAEAVVLGVNSKRRSLLKYIFFGSGIFVAGKILGPSINLFSSEQDIGKSTNFKNFRVVETGKELTFFDKMGNEILSIDKSL